MLISAGQILFLWSWLTGEVCVCVCWPWLSVNPRDRCCGMSSYLGAGAPPLPPFLLFRLVPSLPQEAYGESDWRDLGPRRECSSPQFICSRRGPAGHWGSPEVPVGWESGRVSGFTFRLTALLQCWAVSVATPVSLTQCNFVCGTHAKWLIGHAL